MTNEEKELLLKDLCSRLPYNGDTYRPSELRNVRHFDYHELIPIDPAIRVTKENNPYND